MTNFSFTSVIDLLEAKLQGIIYRCRFYLSILITIFIYWWNQLIG